MTTQRHAFVQQHRLLGSLLCVGALIATCFLWGGVVHAQRRVPTTAPEFYVAELALVAGQNVVLRSTNCFPSGGVADPVFHLLNASGVQVAWSDDDGGGRDALINFTPSTTGTYTLIARSFNPASSGTCTIQRNGANLDVAMPIGGQPLSAINRLVGDTLITRFVPGGSTRHVILRYGPSDTLATGIAIANGIAGAAKLPITSTGGSFLIGTPRFRSLGLSGPIPMFRPGFVEVLSNDPIDEDGDGVGDMLEQAFETCPAEYCSDIGTAHVYVENGKDTDRDGLEDGEELFGVLGTDPDGRDSLNLSRWGANPMRKDVFIEVDSLNTYVGWGVNPFAQLRAVPGSVGFVSDLADKTVEGWAEDIQGRFTPSPVIDHLKNPDSSSRLALHFDLGVDPSDPADEERFGAYSTLSARLVARDQAVTITGTSNVNLTVSINGTAASPFATGGLTPLQVATLIGSRAIATGKPVKVRSCTTSGNTATVTIESSTAGAGFFSLTVTGQGTPQANIQVTPESERSLRDQYFNDSAQVDPVRKGRFRYAVGIPGAGQADGVMFGTGLDPFTFSHELGHTLGLEHWGHSAWGTYGPDCLPHYLSRMNYGNSHPRFSQLETQSIMNPANMTEIDSFGFGPTYPYEDFADDPFNYYTGYNFVDWNRNMVADAPGDRFQTAAISAFNRNCSAYSQGRQSLSGEPAVQGAVDLVRFGNRLYAFWAVNGAVRYRFATLGALSNKSCSGSSDPNVSGSPCLTWSSTYNVALGGDYRSVTVAGFDNSIFLAFNDANGELYARRYSVGSNGVLTNIGNWPFGQASADDKTSDPAELVELNFGSNPVLAILYLSASGHFRERRWTGTAWLTSAPIRDQSGAILAGGQGPAAKSWPDATFSTTPASQRKTIAIFPSSSGQMVIYQRESGVNGNWAHRLSMVTSANQPEITSAKPFIEFRPIRKADGSIFTNAFAGQFMIGWENRGNPTEKTAAMFRFSKTYSTSAPPGATFELLNAGDKLQNGSAIEQVSTSASLYSDSGVANVFGLVAWDIPNLQGVFFLPHADGAPNHDYAVRSDFRVMEDYTCARLRDYSETLICGAVNVLD